jgi:hypothetical protein
VNALVSCCAGAEVSGVFSFFGSTFKRSVSFTVVRAGDFEIGVVTGGATVGGMSCFLTGAVSEA